MPAALWTGRTANPRYVAEELARALTRELGLARDPAVDVLPADSTAVPAGSLLPPRERFSGMPAPTDCYLYIDAERPRPFELRAALMRGRTLVSRSLGLGSLLYAVPLQARLSTQVAVTGGGHLGPQRFTGDPVAAARLNAERNLDAHLTSVAVTTAGTDARHRWQVERLLSVEPQAGGAVLLARTLHRAGTPDWNLRAAAVLDLAGVIERVLTG